MSVIGHDDLTLKIRELIFNMQPFGHEMLEIIGDL